MERKGIEPATSGLQSQQPPPSNPNSDTVKADPVEGCSADVSAQAYEGGSSDHFDARLARVVEAWDDLPDAVRGAIVAMVEAVAPLEPEQGLQDEGL